MEKIMSRGALSQDLHKCLDHIGFGKQRCLERIHTMNKLSQAKDISTKQILNTNSIKKIFVGSQREGVGIHMINDLDILQINHNVYCCSSYNSTPAEENGQVVFELETQNAPPGHSFLKLVSKYHQAKSFDKIGYAVVDEQNGKYLSSKLFMERNDDIFLSGNGFISKNTHYKPPKGPSIPKYVDTRSTIVKQFLSKHNLKSEKMDYVRAFPCNVNHLMQEWSSRQRQCNWPRRKAIAHATSLPAYVVPVGQTESERQDLQWRICFTLAEIHLVQSFNNTQTKVYVLLKLIAKYYLKPVCPCMTSYVMKTIVLWLAETIPQKKFRKKHLFARLYDALRFLQNSIKSGHLSSYMIPGRNLYAGKLQDNEQELVVDKLDFLVQFGQKMTQDFLYESNETNKWAYDLASSILLANELDKVMTYNTATWTADKIGNYCTKMFSYKSKWMMLLYNIVFVLVPSIYVFGLRAIRLDKTTLNIPFTNKLLRNDISIKEKTKTFTESSKSLKQVELFCFVPQDQALTEIGSRETLWMVLMYILSDCISVLDYIIDDGAGVTLFSSYDIKSVFLCFMVVLFAIIKVVYKYNYRRKYARKIYKVKLPFGNGETILLVPRSLLKVNLCTNLVLLVAVTVILATIFIACDQHISRQCPFGSLTLFFTVTQVLVAIIIKLIFTYPKNSG